MKPQPFASAGQVCSVWTSADNSRSADATLGVAAQALLLDKTAIPLLLVGWAVNGFGHIVFLASHQTNSQMWLYKYHCLPSDRPGGQMGCRPVSCGILSVGLSRQNDCSASSGFVRYRTMPRVLQSNLKWWTFLRPGDETTYHQKKLASHMTEQKQFHLRHQLVEQH